MFGEKLINRVMERQKEFGYKTVANGRNTRNINSSRFKSWPQYRKRLKFHISQLLHSFFTIHIFFWCIELQKCYFLNLHYSFLQRDLFHCLLLNNKRVKNRFWMRQENVKSNLKWRIIFRWYPHVVKWFWFVVISRH